MASGVLRSRTTQDEQRKELVLGRRLRFVLGAAWHHRRSGGEVPDTASFGTGAPEAVLT